MLSAAAALGACKAPAVRSITERRVLKLISGVPVIEGAGVHLLRVIGQQALRHLDPFIMLDRFHSSRPEDYERGFPPHPHRGFETVTVMRSGRMRHKDSRGNQGLITDGGSQWMTAGRGIVHSEMPEQTDGLLSGFQLWVNLPANEKMCPQMYQDLQATQLAHGTLTPGGTRVNVITGELQGLVGPVRERPTAPLLLTAGLEDERPLSVELPHEHTSFAYVSTGQVRVGDQVIREGELAVFSPGNRLSLQATESRAELFIAAGRPLHEPIVQRGPFVMATEADLQQAFADYRSGVLDK